MGNIRDERFRTGNRVELYARGAGTRLLLGEGFLGRMGEATGFDTTTNTGAREVHVIGSAEPQDIVDGAHTYGVRVAMVTLVSTEARDIVAAQSIDIDVVDKYTQKKVASCEECHLRSGSVNLPANQLMARNLDFACMRIT